MRVDGIVGGGVVDLTVSTNDHMYTSAKALHCDSGKAMLAKVVVVPLHTIIKRYILQQY